MTMCILVNYYFTVQDNVIVSLCIMNLMLQFSYLFTRINSLQIQLLLYAGCLNKKYGAATKSMVQQINNILRTE